MRGYAKDPELIVTASDDGSATVYRHDPQTFGEAVLGDGRVADFDKAKYNSNKPRYTVVSHLAAADFTDTRSRFEGFAEKSGHSASILSVTFAEMAMQGDDRSRPSWHRFLVTTSADCTAKLWAERLEEEPVDEKKDKDKYEYFWQLRHTFPESHSAKQFDQAHPYTVGAITDLAPADTIMRRLQKNYTSASTGRSTEAAEEEAGEERMLHLRCHQGPVNSACFWRSNTVGNRYGRVATCSDDWHVKLWKFPIKESPTAISEIYCDFHTNGHKGPVTSVSFNRRGGDSTPQLLSASRDGSCILWNPKTKSAITRFSTPGSANAHTGAIWSAYWESTDARILTCGGDSTVRIWDMQGKISCTTFDLTQPLGGSQQIGQPVRATWKDFQVQPGEYPSSPDIVVPCFDGSLRLIDPRASSKYAWSVMAHEACTWSAEYIRYGTHIVTSGHDMTAAIWELRKNDHPLLRICGHKGMLWGASWSPDADRLLTWSEDGTAKVWSVGHLFGDADPGVEELGAGKEKRPVLWYDTLTRHAPADMPKENRVTHSAGVTCAQFIPERGSQSLNA